jgi:hypothetical protein
MHRNRIEQVIGFAIIVAVLSVGMLGVLQRLA